VYRHVENSLKVIRASDNVELSTVSVGTTGVRRIVGIAVSPDSSTLFLVENDAIAIVSTLTDSVTGSIPLVGAAGVAVSPDGLFLYVIGGTNDDTLFRVRLSDNTVVSSTTVGASPRGIAFTPNGSFALVSLITSNTVAIVATSTDRVIDTVAVGNGPYGVAVSPDGTFAYVANASGDTVSRINLAGLTLPPTGADINWLAVAAVALIAAGMAVGSLRRVQWGSRSA
jgi:hypothetical protein